MEVDIRIAVLNVLIKNLTEARKSPSSGNAELDTQFLVQLDIELIKAKSELEALVPIKQARVSNSRPMPR